MYPEKYHISLFQMAILKHVSSKLNKENTKRVCGLNTHTQPLGNRREPTWNKCIRDISHILKFVESHQKRKYGLGDIFDTDK